MTDRTFWERVRTDPAFASWREAQEAIIQAAPAEPPQTLATDYLATGRYRDRSRLDHHCGQNRTIISALTMRRAMLGLDPNDPDDTLLNWLWASLTEPGWSYANMCFWRELPPAGGVSIDLQSCEMAAMMAETLEILRPWVDSVSTTLATTIIKNIDDRVVVPWGEGHRSVWESPDVVNNWIGVCSGTILAACESLAVLGQPRPAARARAVAGLRRFLHDAFTPGGECDEGVGYWGYGIGYASVGWSRLTREELEASVDMDRFRQVADYPRRAHLFGNDFYAGNDSRAHCAPAWNFVPWLAAASGNDWLARWMAASNGTAPLPQREFSTSIRNLDAWVSFHDGAAPHGATEDAGALASLVARETARLLEDQQAAILRTRTPAGELLATLVGGHNDERHNHNHLGNLQVALNGRFILPDFGPPQPYPADFFGERRYLYLPASSRGHSCPLIDGQEQRPGHDAAGKIVSWQPDGDRPHLQLDLTPGYPPEAGLRRWTRQLECEQAAGTMVVTDEFETEPARPITHVFWSLEQPAVLSAGDGTGEEPCRIALGDALAVEVTPAPTSPVEIETVKADDHNLASLAGRTFYRVALTYSPEARRGIVTRFSPRVAQV